MDGKYHLRSGMETKNGQVSECDSGHGRRSGKTRISRSGQW
ncbi:DUF1131 family protein [Xenorhabdus thailandensis]